MASSKGSKSKASSGGSAQQSNPGSAVSNAAAQKQQIIQNAKNQIYLHYNQMMTAISGVENTASAVSHHAGIADQSMNTVQTVWKGDNAQAYGRKAQNFGADIRNTANKIAGEAASLRARADAIRQADLDALSKI